MSEKRVIRIVRTEPAKCDLCGTVAELRPYGPNGENICFECGMKNEEATQRQFHRLTDGALTIIDEEKEKTDA